MNDYLFVTVVASFFKMCFPVIDLYRNQKCIHELLHTNPTHRDISFLKLVNDIEIIITYTSSFRNLFQILGLFSALK